MKIYNKRILILVLLALMCSACSRETNIPEVLAGARESMYIQVFESENENIDIHFTENIEKEKFSVVTLMLDDYSLESDVTINVIESTDTKLVLSLNSYVKSFNQVKLTYEEKEMIVDLPHYFFDLYSEEIKKQDLETVANIVSLKSSQSFEVSETNFIVKTEEDINISLLIADYNPLMIFELSKEVIDENHYRYNYALSVDDNSIDSKIKTLIIEVIYIYEKDGNKYFLLGESIPLDI